VRDGEEAGAGAEIGACLASEPRGVGLRTSESELSLSLWGRSFSKRMKEERDFGRMMEDSCWMELSWHVTKARVQRLA
jgi:hypothetical protein